MDFYQIAERLGIPVAMLLIALVTGQRGLWIWKRELDECRLQRDEQRREKEEYKRLAFDLSGLSHKSLSVAEKVVRKDG
jgi:Tfp pilus assembly protein PilO